MNASMQKKKSKNKGEQPWKKPSKVSQAPNSRKKKTYIGKKHKSHRSTPWVEEEGKEKVKNQEEPNEEASEELREQKQKSNQLIQTKKLKKKQKSEAM